MTANPGNSPVKVRVAPPYGDPYVRTMEQVSEIFEVSVATVKAWCVGRENPPYKYKVGYESEYVPGMSDESWRSPMSKEAKSMYERMKERRRRELGE